jgi:hypothetical protein
MANNNVEDDKDVSWTANIPEKTLTIKAGDKSIVIKKFNFVDNIKTNNRFFVVEMPMVSGTLNHTELTHTPIIMLMSVEQSGKKLSISVPNFIKLYKKVHNNEGGKRRTRRRKHRKAKKTRKSRNRR